ncbi:MAG: hypothetical protein ABSE73_15585 [Planctomycetota bacterium]
MKRSIGLSLVFALAFGLAISVRADTVTLLMKSGQTLEGDVISENDNSIELEVEYGTMRVPKSRILKRIDDTPEIIAERERKKEEEQDLADRMKDEGKVLYKGKWVTDKEKDEAEKKAKEAADKKKKQRAEAKKKADEEAKRKEAEAKKLEQEWQKQEQQTGNQNASRHDRLMNMQNNFQNQNMGTPFGVQSYGQNQQGGNYGGYNGQRGY